MPQVYRGRSRRNLSNMFDADHAEGRHAGRFRWMLSTCLAAAVGAVAIGVVISGSLENREAGGAVPSVLSRLRDTTPDALPQRKSEGLRWTVPKSDLMQPSDGAPTIRQLIHEQIQVRRNGRPYHQIRPYVRISTRLLPVQEDNSDVIPPFNPFALYGAPPGSRKTATGTTPGGGSRDVKLQIVELLGSTMPIDDGLLLATAEVAELVLQFQVEEALRAQSEAPQSSAATTSGDAAASAFSRPIADPSPPNTTIIRKQPAGNEQTAESLEKQVRRVHTMQRGDRLGRVLRNMGGDKIQVGVMLAAMKPVLAEDQISTGLQVHVTLVPSLVRQELEPARFSVFTEDGRHRVSVMRNSAGEFIASAHPFESTVARAALSDSDNARAQSIYAAIYNAALKQGIPSTHILQKLRVHAYDTDFRRRIRPGDFAEYFFDLHDENGTEGSYGDLLYTSIATGGEIHRFWRFRTPDGEIDYYDDNGNNSRKFLLRRPVRGEQVRLASGFGMRYHPILRYARPHNGLDWAAPTGTPILAAGNGTIEEARYRGEFGNYVRISHANGYTTAYAHLSRYHPRTRQGARVRLGEIIGYIGTTGLSAGPHLHYEVLVNSRPVDPLSIQVPRERRLTGKPLADYQKERARISDLMRRQAATLRQR